MIDTHTHLYFPEYGEEIEEIMKRAISNGVRHFILPNVDENSITQIKDFNAKYPQYTSAAMGLHPTEVKEDWEEIVAKIEKELKTGNYVASGEIGMDLYWDQTYRHEQVKAFAKQLNIANNLELPAIIHSRSALDDTLKVIGEIKPTIPLIFHSFTGSPADVKKIREICDPYFGINGVVTYKNAPELREALPEIGIEKILLETDAPFLTPAPHRGKRNDSSFLGIIRDKIAEVLGMIPEEVEKITDQNASHIFKI